MARIDRVRLIDAIQKARDSRVIAYFCSDRQCATGQIGEDAVRPMYDVVRAIGPTKRIDVFIYSHGGALEVPWRIIAMLREHCDQLGALVPYCAHSAATLVALGCDELVLGPKAELGPIDPALKVVIREGNIIAQEDVRVEDVMSYIDFLKDKAKIADDKTIGKHTHALAERLRPWTVGQVYRIHSHIRMVAERMLRSHARPKDEGQMTKIISALAEETRSHGHGISRREAQLLGLPVVCPETALEQDMWSLFECYEQASSVRDPIDPETALGVADETAMRVVLAWIESTDATWAFRGDLKIARVRPPAPRYDVKASLTFNVNFTPPPGVDLQNIPPEVLSHLRQHLLAQVQSQIQHEVEAIPGQVQRQVQTQSPKGELHVRVVGKWLNVTHEGI